MCLKKKHTFALKVEHYVKISGVEGIKLRRKYLDLIDKRLDSNMAIFVIHDF